LIANRNPGIREFIERIDVKNLPHEVRDRYMRSIHYYNTTIVDIEEKAVEKGFEKGKKETSVKIAHELKKLKIPTDQIVKATGLSAAEIDDIKAEDLDS
jgi:predicted transposase/invertase (TIGR01784 family)